MNKRGRLSLTFFLLILPILPSTMATEPLIVAMGDRPDPAKNASPAPSPPVADPPKGFSGISWGASIDKARQAFSGEPGRQLIRETPARLSYFGGSFAGIPVERWELDFIDGVFFRGTAYLAIPRGTDIDGTPLRNSQFDDLAALVMAKYGDGKRKTTGNNVSQEWEFPGSGDTPKSTVFLKFNWFEPFQFYIQYTRKPQRAQSEANSVISDDI